MSNLSIADLFAIFDKDVADALREEALHVRNLICQAYEPGFLHKNSSLVEGSIYEWHAALVQAYVSKVKVLPKNYPVALSEWYISSF